MALDLVLWEWLSAAVRWLHVIAGIAWIGSSFYFIALDLGLRRRDGMAEGLRGEAWQVHGGGFYHIQKYTVAPEALPERLTWFKWEAYTTWLSGAALLALVYYASAKLYLIDPRVADLAPWQAVAISVASIAAGWLAYDRLCRSPLGADQTALLILLYFGIVSAAASYAQVFSGRAALVHLGVLTGTLMVANVFFVIIPNQRVVVADLKAGRTSAAHLGEQAKQRSLHNNYLTLPVVFLMLSPHWPLAFASPANWAIAALLFPMGAAIRHYFNTLHATGRGPLWTWGAAALFFGCIVWLSTWQRPEQVAGISVEFAAVEEAVVTRCSMCHAAEPLWDGLAIAPKGVVLESRADIAIHARAIYLQAGVTDAMPPGNVTAMEPAERASIRAWVEQGAR